MGIGWNINHALSCTMLIGRRDEANFEHTKISANLNNLRPKNKGGEREEESGEEGRRQLKCLRQTLEYANLNKIIKNRKFEFPKRATQPEPKVA